MTKQEVVKNRSTKTVNGKPSKTFYSRTIKDIWKDEGLAYGGAYLHYVYYDFDDLKDIEEGYDRNTMNDEITSFGFSWYPGYD